MGCSAASAGTGNKVEMVAGRRKKVWDGEFSAVHSQMCVAVCLHLQVSDTKNKDITFYALFFNGYKNVLIKLGK